MSSAVIDSAGLQQLLSVLIDRGYRVVGPRLSDNAIVLSELTSADDLPRGWGVDVAPGRYRLRRRDDNALFGHSAGPQSWKQFLHPPRQRLWSSDGAEPDEPPRYAFIGVRACDLSAIKILNGVLGAGTHPDQGFVGRLKRIFVVAVNCTEPGGLCFCASMGTGPEVGPGYDLALTERIADDSCHYVVDVGSDDGAGVLAALPIGKSTKAKSIPHDNKSARQLITWAVRCPTATCASCWWFRGNRRTGKTSPTDA